MKSNRRIKAIGMRVEDELYVEYEDGGLDVYEAMKNKGKGVRIEKVEKLDVDQQLRYGLISEKEYIEIREAMFENQEKRLREARVMKLKIEAEHLGFNLTEK